jgi:PadR family transcriptional regulator PadR
MQLSRTLAAASHRPLILSLLEHGPKYGFQLVHSKLYPLLHAMEAEGLVEAYWEPSESGPDRKYYRLTAAGKKALDGVRSEWAWMYGMFDRLWRGEVAFT